MAQIRGNTKLGQPKSARLNMKTGSLSNRAWWAMRRLQRFTKVELLCTVATAQDKSAPSQIGAYLRALTAAGILTVEAKRAPGKSPSSNGHLVYRLEINCGHKAPLWRIKAKQVYDPNNGITYAIGESLNA
jgi:hypothetical protein